MKDAAEILANISTNLRRALEQRNLSQRKLAILCGENHVMISQMVRGENMPGVVRLANVAAALETTVDYLIADHAEDISYSLDRRKRGKSLASAG